MNQNKKSQIKIHYLTVRSIKSAGVFIEDWAFALFFRFLPLCILQLKSPHPWGFAIQGKGGGVGTPEIDL